jgi:LPXTG-site transpeptidase (sortase) family protein
MDEDLDKFKETTLKIIAFIFIFSGLGLLTFIFFPIAQQELRYNFDQMSRVKYVIGTEQLATFEKPLNPPDTAFSIIIPKIGAAAPIIDDIDFTDPNDYLPALKKGVAHARGSGIPNQKGNVFLFAHASDAFWNVTQYNAIFYLIGKLNTGDEIDIFYRGVQYKYEVYDKKIVNADSSQYLGTLIPDAKTLTLETGYPEGTIFKHLIVFANQTLPI